MDWSLCLSPFSLKKITVCCFYITSRMANGSTEFMICCFAITKSDMLGNQALGGIERSSIEDPLIHITS